jgi:AcrR family transcriptional regulator
MPPRSPRPAPTAHRTGSRERQKYRTRRELMDTAISLVGTGLWPTVAEVADAAHVSRRTAYRYFPTQAQLLIEAALDGVRPAMAEAMAQAPSGRSEGDLEARVDALVRSMQQLTAAHESLLRTLVHLTVLPPQSSERPRRGVRRLEWIAMALEPARPGLPRAAYERLVSALSLITGIEAMLVLRDIRGLTDGQALAVSQWMAQAVLRETLAESRRRVGRRARATA